MVDARPDRRADDGIGETDFLGELAHQRIDMALAGLEAAAGQRPPRRSGELEANEQHAIVGIDHECAYGIAYPKSGVGVGGHSSGVLLRPSLNMRYIS